MDTLARPKPLSFFEIFRRSPVVAVVTLSDAALAVPVAQALVRGGVKTMEITLRTDAGLVAIEKVAREVPEILVGAGTVLRTHDMSAAIGAGAKFTISPGSTPDLMVAGAKSGVPYLPGIGTASELMVAMEHGYDCFKVFPVMAMGGALLPRILGGPFPRAHFCANGGVSLETSSILLHEPNVHAVGAGWLTPADLLAKRDYTGIEVLARAASEGLRKH
jgi:2-dehydro-3-deoxyphosphogluconate aldolase / (4S)-4-hydroxy-2-oxoglutarate aldolase